MCRSVLDIVYPSVATCIEYQSILSLSLSGIYHLSLYGEDPWGPSGEGHTSTCMCTRLLPYLISVISLHTCVFSSVKDTSTPYGTNQNLPSKYILLHIQNTTVHDIG